MNKKVLYCNVQEHYIPVWEKVPEEAVEAVKWAKANDAEASRIAANGQRFAVK